MLFLATHVQVLLASFPDPLLTEFNVHNLTITVGSDTQLIMLHSVFKKNIYICPVLSV